MPSYTVKVVVFRHAQTEIPSCDKTHTNLNSAILSFNEVVYQFSKENPDAHVLRGKEGLHMRGEIW